MIRRILLILVLSGMGAGLCAQPINTKESKVPSYTLPDPLLTEAGNVVKNRRQWEKVRRPELMALFETEMFGCGDFTQTARRALVEDKHDIPSLVLREL